MCIPCDWLLLGDVTNSLLKRNKPSILLSTCRVVYTLLVSSSYGPLYQCDFKTYSLVCHVQMLVVTHKQTDKRTDTQNDKTLSMCLHCGRPQHCLCHLSSLLISWCWWYFRLAATVTANYHNHDIRQGEAGQLSHSLEASRLLRCVCTTPGFLCWTCRGCVFCWRWCWCVNR